MGYLQNSDTLTKNTLSEIDKILQSGSAISIMGMGEPVLVTWLNVNDKKSTVIPGIETVDSLIGKDSPFRYNRVEDLPVYGITKELQNIEMQADDNGIMDMNIELDGLIAPGTIIPSSYDIMIYKFASGRSVVFRVNNVQISTLRSNGFYRVPMHMIEIDETEYEEQLTDMTVAEMQVVLDNVGTNKACVVTKKTFDEMVVIDEILRQAISDYVDMFYSRRYNSFIFKGYDDSDFIIYDPYLTKFILNHKLLEKYDEIIQPVVIDADDSFRGEYNKTIFRAVELRDKKKIKPLLYELGEFSRKRTNPFSFWGEEVVYLLSTYEDKAAKYPKHNYMDFHWLYNINTVNESNAVTMLENIIIRFFKKEDFEKFADKKDLEDLKEILEPEHTEAYFYLVPVVLYILMSYKDYINKA